MTFQQPHRVHALRTAHVQPTAAVILEDVKLVEEVDESQCVHRIAPICTLDMHPACDRIPKYLITQGWLDDVFRLLYTISSILGVRLKVCVSPGG